MSEDEDKFDVTIKGQITGYQIATIERVQKLEKEIEKQDKGINNLMKQVNQQKELLDVINARVERLESFLSSFTSKK